jgi:cytoskeleton protein RodZ
MQTESSPSSAHATLGQQLREHRLARLMSIDDAAMQLKLPASIVEAMERDDRQALGAAVFARGRLASYAKLVGIPVQTVEAQFAAALVAPPQLVSRARSSRLDHALRRFARQGVYIVLTATIVLPVVWLATHDQLPQSPVALTVLDRPAAPTPDTSHAASNTARPVRENREESPVAASLAPFSGYHWNHAASPGASGPAIDAAANPSLQLRFSGDSWIEITGTDGRIIDHGPVEAGSVRNYRAGAVARVTIGNPGSVLVLRNGEPVDLKAFQNANTTRFTLSPDGTPSPVDD